MNNLPIKIYVKKSKYKSEPWFTAEVFTDVWCDYGHSRSPAKAVAFALDNLSRKLKGGDINVSIPQEDDFVEEILDMSEFKDLEGK